VTINYGLPSSVYRPLSSHQSRENRPQRPRRMWMALPTPRRGAPVLVEEVLRLPVERAPAA